MVRSVPGHFAPEDRAAGRADPNKEPVGGLMVYAVNRWDGRGLKQKIGMYYIQTAMCSKTGRSTCLTRENFQAVQDARYSLR